MSRPLLSLAPALVLLVGCGAEPSVVADGNDTFQAEVAAQASGTAAEVGNRPRWCLPEAFTQLVPCATSGTGCGSGQVCLVPPAAAGATTGWCVPAEAPVRCGATPAVTCPAGTSCRPVPGPGRGGSGGAGTSGGGGTAGAGNRGGSGGGAAGGGNGGAGTGGAGIGGAGIGGAGTGGGGIGGGGIGGGGIGGAGIGGAGTGGAGSGSAIWRPTPGTSWQWQLTGTLDTSLDVQAYDIDLFETSPQAIAALHAQGRKVICYFSAGSYEPGRPDSSQFPAATLGNGLDGWPGERWLDTRAQAVRDLMTARLALAAQKGCDAVEPDNVDGYANRNGHGLTAADQLDYNRFLADSAHARGLSVGLKNDLDQVQALVSSFDWALDEQCFQYDECDLLRPFIAANKAVFEVEYGSASLATSVCPRANALGFDTLIKDLDLGPRRIACR